jgi:hypothetical protein
MASQNQTLDFLTHNGDTTTSIHHDTDEGVGKRMRCCGGRRNGCFGKKISCINFKRMIGHFLLHLILHIFTDYMYWFKVTATFVVTGLWISAFNLLHVFKQADSIDGDGIPIYNDDPLEKVHMELAFEYAALATLIAAIGGYFLDLISYGASKGMDWLDNQVGIYDEVATAEIAESRHSSTVSYENQTLLQQKGFGDHGNQSVKIQNSIDKNLVNRSKNKRNLYNV